VIGVKNLGFKTLIKVIKGKQFDTQLIYRLADAADVNVLTLKVNVLYLLAVLTED